MMQKTDTRSRTSALRRGLDDTAAELSRRKYGSNVLRRRKSRSFIARFFNNLGDPVIKVLLGALAANIIFTIGHTDWIETLGIALSVITATTVSTISEYGGEAAFGRLAAEAERGMCRVRRGGSVRMLPISDIVVGDVVLLGAGEAVPADGYIISGRIVLDQSAMTGETREVEKTALQRLPNDRPCDDGNTSGSAGACAAHPAYECTACGSPQPSDPCGALRGCLVIGGGAEMLVTAVGDSTSLGGISGELQEETRESPLKLRLSRLASQISRLGYAAAAIVAAAFLFNAFVADSGYIGSVILMKLRDTSYLMEKLLAALTLGLTVVVVAVPEGLPMMIAVVLSANIRRMVGEGVLVRKPVGIEAAGSMNILFTDKTGTLTEGRMSVGGIILGDGRQVSSPAELRRCFPALWREYRASAYLNTASSPGHDSKGSGQNVMIPIGGNAADRAIMASALEFEPPSTDADNIYADLPSCTRRLDFDSKRKYSACRCAADGGRVYIKGAPEVLLPRACGYIDEHGNAHRADLRRFALSISALRRGGGRVLLIAEGRGECGEGMIPHDLYIIAAVELRDRLRKTSAQTVGELRGAGIKVVMITGDSAETAEAIARSCGILGRGAERVLTSSELAGMSDDEIGEILPQLGVVARAVPSDKSRLVKIAQERGLVVGMTGDGINDAPALRRADIGFAMGSGTDVAREASDIVLLRDDLSSVASSVLYGRNIFKSIRKFITLQLTMNLCAVGVSMIGPFIGIDAPVTVVQMLWINIIMDTLGGLAFAGEGALPACMREPPKRRDEPILNRYMINQIATLGSFTVALSLAFLKLPFFTDRFRYAVDDRYLLTAFFAFFIFAGVFNCFNARTDRLNILANIKKNPAFITIMSAVLIIQIGFVYLGGEVLRTVPLTPRELAWAMFFSLAVFPIDFLRKLFWRLRKNGGGY